jgi:predicted CoA-binding protein
MDKQLIDAFLGEPALAIVGVSRSGRKFGNIALRTLSAKGLRVYPIHPFMQAVEGVRCYRRFRDLPEPVGAVLVVVPPSQAVQVVRDAAEAGIKKVWLQQGAESAAVLQACKDAGVNPVYGECILMFAHPAGVHKFHHWVRGVFHRLPA